MASFAVSGATLGLARAASGGGVSSVRSGGERRGGVDLPSLLFRKKDSFSRTVLSCAGAPGKVLLPGGGSDDLLSSAEPAAGTTAQPEESQIPEDNKAKPAEASTAVGAEDKLESSEPTQGIEETITDGVTKGVKELVVEEKPLVIPVPGDGQRIYKIDPMLEGFRSHLDYRYSEYKRIRAAIDQHEGGLDAFSRAYEKLGFTRSLQH